MRSGRCRSGRHETISSCFLTGVRPIGDKKEKGFGTDGAKRTALVMEVESKRVAVLISNDDTRTLGSKTCSAGNGGELRLGADCGGKMGISEDLVVATCLHMLEKEIDRRRSVDFMMIAAVIV